MNEEETNTKPKKGGTPPESVLRQKIVPYADEIVEKLLEHMRSRNPNVSLGAANTLLKKIIPDIKALELTGKDGQPLQLSIKLDMAGGYIPSVGVAFTASTASSTGPTQIQGTGVAQESKEDDNSTNGTNQAGSI